MGIISIPYAFAVCSYIVVNVIASAVCRVWYQDGDRVGCRRVLCGAIVDLCVRFAFVIMWGRVYEVAVYSVSYLYRGEIQAGYGDTTYKFPPLSIMDLFA